MSIEKRPGADWEVIYRDSNGVYGHAVIFGLNDFSQLEKELVSALPDDADVIQIKRKYMPRDEPFNPTTLPHCDETDDEIILKAIEVIEREVIGEGCKTPDYEEFADDPETRITPDINEQGRCYCCAATQVVRWLRCYV